MTKPDKDGWTSMKIVRLVAVAATMSALAACENSDADIVSKNLSQAADMFEINRRIVFYNGMTGEYVLTIEGLCSIGNSDSVGRLSVTCKTGPKTYKKHFLGVSATVTFFAEQIEASPASPYQYRVTFKPLSIIPDIEVRK